MLSFYQTTIPSTSYPWIKYTSTNLFSVWCIVHFLASSSVESIWKVISNRPRFASSENAKNLRRKVELYWSHASWPLHALAILRETMLSCSLTSIVYLGVTLLHSNFLDVNSLLKDLFQIGLDSPLQSVNDLVVYNNLNGALCEMHAILCVGRRITRCIRELFLCHAAPCRREN